MAVDLSDMDDPIYRSRRDEPPWPEWLTGFRDHQVTAVEQIIDAYDHGVGVVFLDAPTGSGKTTTIRMLCCLISITNGDVEIAGYKIGNDTDSLSIRKANPTMPSDSSRLFMPLTAAGRA